jgi:hypothetical protein
LKDINYKELYYIFNSYSPVLNIYKITEETYLIELYSNEVSKVLAEEYNECILTVEKEEKESDKMNCYYIDNKIENIIINKKESMYYDIYNDKYNYLYRVIKNCHNDKILYDKNLLYML